MAMTSLLIRVFLVSLLAAIVSAQLAPSITNPASNSTIRPGDKITIEYEYGNIGTGNYTVDIALWNDASATETVGAIADNHPVEGGNSTGFQLNYTYPATFDWTVQGGLKFVTNDSNGTRVEVNPKIMYLTVTVQAETELMGTVSSRSRPVLLHYSAATAVTPGIAFILLTIVSVLLCRF